jgi:hypothetical protein
MLRCGMAMAALVLAEQIKNGLDALGRPLVRVVACVKGEGAGNGKAYR